MKMLGARSLRLPAANRPSPTNPDQPTRSGLVCGLTLLEDRTGIFLQMPTNVAFFGADLRQLAIAALGGWTVTAIDLPFAGMPVHYPVI